MDAIFKKLNYKEEKQVFVLNAPDSFEENISSIADNAEVLREVPEDAKVEYAVCFAMKQETVDRIAETIGPKLVGDATLWMCYPKKSSKRYTCDFNRDTGWSTLGEFGLEGVRMVAIDEDWSALRFRKVDYIKKFTRNKKMVLSEKGKKRLEDK